MVGMTNWRMCVHGFVVGAFVWAATSIVWAEEDQVLSDFEGYEGFELYEIGLKKLYGFDDEKVNRGLALELLKKAAGQDYAPAYTLLGSQLLEGQGWFSSPRKANRMFEKGAALNDAQSKFNLGYSYRVGRGTRKDLEKAKDLFLEVVEPEKPYLISPENFGTQKATEAAAYFNLGGLYLEEDSIEFDIEKAHGYLMKGDELGSALSAMILAIHFAMAEHVERDDEKADYYLDRYDLLSQNSMKKNFGNAYFIGMNRETEVYLDEMKNNFVDVMEERITQMQVGFGISLLTDEDKYDPKRAARWLEMGLKGENKVARLRLARLYYRGEGVEESKERARALLEEIGRDEYLGDYNLGVMLLKGEGGEADEEKGEQLMLRAAEGDLFAARAYLEDGVEPSYLTYEEALEICEEEAEKGNIYAKHSLGVRYLNGYGVDPSEKKAKELIKTAAEEGCAAAQYTFGTRFSGLLEPFSYGFTKKWVEAAAAQDYLPAIHYQALMIENGFVYQRNVGKSIELYRDCAERGYADSQRAMGRIYREGVGVHIDEKMAVEYYQKAADQDEPIAMMFLGLAYRDGEGVDQDKLKAFEVLKRSADIGSLRAYHELGKFFEKGELGETDWEEAIYWYEKAGDYGYTDSMKALAKIYLEGKGVEASRLLALNWYSRAAQRNYYDYASQYEIAKLLADPDWSEGDPKQALTMFRNLEIGGNIPSKFHLAMMNYKGIAMEQSDKKAIVKFRKMATFGPYTLETHFGDEYKAIMKTKPKFTPPLVLSDSDAEEIHGLAAESAYILGMMTREGRGVGKSERFARLWFGVAAGAGNSKAQFEMGNAKLEDGDRESAIEWFERSAESGNAEAQFVLGKMHFSEGVESIEEEAALAWLKSAATQSHEEAIKLLNQLNIPWGEQGGDDSEKETDDEFDFRGIMLGCRKQLGACGSFS